jgi:adenylate cyclase class IV
VSLTVNPIQVMRTCYLYAFQDKTAELIFYDRPEGDGPKLSKYEKCTFPDGSQITSILTHALGVKGRVKKNRQLFMVGQTRVHIDHVEDLGNFMELEVST